MHIPKVTKNHKLYHVVVKENGTVVDERKRWYTEADIKDINQGFFLVKQNNPEMEMEITELEVDIDGTE